MDGWARKGNLDIGRKCSVGQKGMKDTFSGTSQLRKIRFDHQRIILIQTFSRTNFSFTNIFEHLFVSNLFVQIYSDISVVLKLDEYLNMFENSYNFQYKYLFEHSFVSNLFVQIYSAIRSLECKK